MFIFALSVLFVFLVLAAQYESWSLPIAIILIVPMGILSALIVEFARQAEVKGKDPIEAVVGARRLRLRPILMTAFAGMLGVTFFGLFLTPVSYVALRTLVLRISRWSTAKQPARKEAGPSAASQAG